MVPLGDPRLTDPFDVAHDGRILDAVTFVVRGARLTLPMTRISRHRPLPWSRDLLVPTESR